MNISLILNELKTGVLIIKGMYRNIYTIFHKYFDIILNSGYNKSNLEVSYGK